MKAGSVILVTALLLASALGGGLGVRHFQAKAPAPYLKTSVQPADIEAAVTAMGALDAAGGMVRASISEVDIPRVRIGQTAYFTRVGLPDQRYPGRVMSMTAMPAIFASPQAAAKTQTGAREEISDEAEDPEALEADETDQAVTETPAKAAVKANQPRPGVFYNVVFRLDDPSKVPPASSLMVHVVQGVVKQAPAISRAALQEQLAENRYRVEVIDAQGQLSRREITTGLFDELSIEIKDGLSLGDEVVIKDDGSLYDPGYRG